jgi:hypothetical protein
MPKYVIERDVPGFGSSSPEELAEAARKSNAVITEMSPRIQWLHSYVVADKTYCVYIAPDKETILEHARKSGFPANVIEKVVTMIDPTTGE